MRLLVAGAAIAVGVSAASYVGARELTIEDRVAAQKAIEEVYWRHRIWPKDNPTPKPALDAVMPVKKLRAKVEDSLKKSNALEAWWRRPITGEQLQAELERMAHSSHDPRMLQELFDALGGDAFLIAETVARPLLAERLARNWYASDERFRATTASRPNPTFDDWWRAERTMLLPEVNVPTTLFSLPVLAQSGCTNDTWTPTPTDVPDGRSGHTVVWTGTEMIVWGGDSVDHELNTGGRYNPSTDTWRPISLGADSPPSSVGHTAVWTGTEMIVWGGRHTDYATGDSVYRSAGSRYDPMSDTWTTTSTGANAPTGRSLHTAVWTGTEMIIWGGFGSPVPSGGARYRPASDDWLPISNVNAAQQVFGHTAVWTGSKMIIWGGMSDSGGGRYDPVTDTWAPTSTGANAPSPRSQHTAVWTGTEMIVWGGNSSGGQLNTGARYDPTTDAWAAVSTGSGTPSARSRHTAVWTGSGMVVSGGAGGGDRGAIYYPSNDAWVGTEPSALAPRFGHTAIWTGTEMIVWGGELNSREDLNTGARYNPMTDSWVATSMGTTVPAGRQRHTAIWTGTEMIVWGGSTNFLPSGFHDVQTGGCYTPSTDSWVPTSLGSDTPSPRELHSAVWTGREMIVWGGSYGVNLQPIVTNTGARYDPLTDTWLATSTGVYVAAARQNASVEWTGKEMIVAPNGSNYPGGRYDPIADSWKPMSMGPIAPLVSFGRASVWTGTEMIVFGGRYNPTTDSWSAISTGADAPAWRSDSSTIWTGTKMIVWGGFGISFGGVTTTGGQYDPSTDSWLPTSTGANVASKRSMHTAIWTGTEMIVWGGEWPMLNNIANAGGRYDPLSDSWSPISMGAGFPASHKYHTSVWTGTEMIVWGGEPGTATGGRYCACPSGRLIYRDADGDGYGDPGASRPSCDGSTPTGFVLDHTDCNDAASSAHPGAIEVCDGIDDDCDDLIDEIGSAVDTDGDTVHELCDNCPDAINPTQSDFDNDGQGDACDLNDGLIFEWRADKESVSWQAEQGPTSWNLYIGDLDVLKATGVYTQVVGSNPLAGRQCGTNSTVADDLAVPDVGKVSFSLVAGVTAGVEGALGSSSVGPRSNQNPCP